MTEGDPDGARIAELFLAEIAGRELDRFGELSVEGLDHPARFTCSIGDSYNIVRAEQSVATVEVYDDHVAIDIDADPILIDQAATVKAALDEVLDRLAQ